MLVEKKKNEVVDETDEDEEQDQGQNTFSLRNLALNLVTLV